VLLKLTEEQINYVKITFNTDRFVVKIGEVEPVVREYYSVPDMLREFEENGIESADFDGLSHEVYNRFLEKSYKLSEVLS
jgi:hypothetical protein